jgi:hypothetical protein
MNSALLNLGVIRSADLERSARFYAILGLTFTRHRHGNGPEHLTSELGALVFEIYPRLGEGDSTASTRIGFRVHSIDDVVKRLQEIGIVLVSPAKDSPWGRRAVVDDFDGHRAELVETEV